MGGIGFGYILVMILGLIISGIASLWVKRSYSKHSKEMSASGMTGAQVARSILDRNGLTNVRVEPVAGQLTDHYDPGAKVVRLSEDNYNKPSIAGVSVAAHEVGHAVQDATGYAPMKLRSGLVPIANFSNQLFMPLILMGIFIAPFFFELAAIVFAGVLLFHVVTLPVEINASTRAYGQLTNYGFLSRKEAGGTKRVLSAAAFT
ncbi:MAG: zinc metallopeptidase, partial [Rubrobacter sp.]|nr:zinc metallopeptidase [Rubrobacter sp.]